jgi:hypothetical protein
LQGSRLRAHGLGRGSDSFGNFRGWSFHAYIIISGQTRDG